MPVLYKVSFKSAIVFGIMITNIKQNCAVKSLIHDMVLEDLIVESLWSAFSGRHICRFVVCVELIRSTAIKKRKSFVEGLWY